MEATTKSSQTKHKQNKKGEETKQKRRSTRHVGFFEGLTPPKPYGVFIAGIVFMYIVTSLGVFQFHITAAKKEKEQT